MVVGDVNGQFRDVFKKLSGLHAKNDFSFAIVVGSLFADPMTASPQDDEDVVDLLSNKVEVPLTTYFALGSTALPAKVIEKLESSSGEACSNLFFLGKRTIIKTSDGIRIVALGGNLDPNITVGASRDKYPPYYGEDDARVLRGANSADILITNQWPAKVMTGSKAEFSSEEMPSEHQCIAELCMALKPRYHFSVSADAFYEREPFFYAPDESSGGYRTTRFISLAKYNNLKKQKWIYAFTFDRNTSLPTTVPAGSTASPFSSAAKKRQAPTNDGSSYRFSSDTGRHHKPHKKHKASLPTPSECFFCLSNPNVATHLIVSIGDEVYLTTAKGPLTTASFFPQLGFPSHILLIPMSHVPTLASIDTEETRSQTYDEMQRFRGALHSMLRKKSGGELGSVTWEVSRTGGVHTHWQFLPVSSGLISRGLVEAAFKVQSENEKYPTFFEKEVKEGNGEGDFFRVLIWDPSGKEGAEVEKSLILPLDSSFRFDLQFGRKVLAKLLGLEQRVHWQDCGQSQEEEAADAQAFKEAFKEFDFSLDG